MELILKNKNIKLRCILTLGLTQTISWASSYYLPAILAIPISKELGCPVSLVYAGFSLALVVSALVVPIAGKYVDAVGGKRILAVSSILFCISLFFLSTVQGTASLFFALGSLGVAMGTGLYSIAFASIVRFYGVASAPVIAGVTLFAGFASTLGWPLTQYFTEAFSWRQAVLFWSCVQLFLAFPLNLSLPIGVKQGDSLTKETTPADTTITPPRKEKTLYLLASAFVFVSFCSAAMTSHMPKILQLHGATPLASLAAGMFLGPSQVFARILQLTLLRSVKPIQTAILGVLVIPFGAISMMFFGVGALPLVGITHGFGNGIMTIVKGTLPLSLFGRAGYGQRQGWLFLPASIVEAFTPFIFSVCIDWWGKDALLVYVISCLVAVILLICLREGKRHNRE